jgi:hypothetical protein
VILYPQSAKINLKIVENFQGPKTCCFLSTFTTHFTTFLPSNNHVLHTTFSKTPLKNKGKPRFPAAVPC